MKRLALPFALAGTVLAGAAAFATERGLAWAAAREARLAAHREIEDALRLAARHPNAFGIQAAPGESSLKSLAQETAARRGLQIGALSESERELDRGRRERQVVVRVVDAPHAELVRFLDDLEAQGAGAKVKEIHLRPSETRNGAYEEAEVVVSRVVTVEKP